MKRVINFNPLSLREARIAKKKSMTDLATLLQISRQAISSYEKGDKSPSIKTIEKMSKILDKPISFFYIEKDRILQNESFYSFRSLSKTTKKDRESAIIKDKWLTDLYIYINQYIEFPKVAVPDFNIDDLDEIDLDSIDQVAEDTRKIWGLSNHPISNIQQLFENNGIVTANIFMPSSLDAFSIWKTNNTPFILLSNNTYFGRHRFNLCHELGHLILHRKLNGDLLLEKDVHKKVESQAHRFASAFLMPRDTFLQDIYSISIESFIRVKERWKVSIQAIIYRLSDLGVINTEKQMSLRKRLSFLGYNKKEPLDSDIKSEKPVLIQKAIKFLIDQKILTPDQFLYDIKLSVSDIIELTGLNTDFFDDKKSLNNIIQFNKRN
ncbi:MAG TPA: ImmA/IrrE family metallo-endopeptidase [Ignavibacteria bacterium]|nr:ImmA/IrrE family metallo-endopeptidase [Ignavibacteria bacterium]